MKNNLKFNLKIHTMKTNVILKTVLLLSFYFVILSNVMSQNWITLGDKGKTETTINLVSSSEKEIVVDFSINAYKLNEVSLQSGKAVYPVISNGIPLLEKGSPNLSRLNRSVIIPDMAEMQAEVISSNYVEINNVDIAPSKGSFSKKIKPETVPFTYNETYQQNAFFPGKLVDLGDPYILRDFRGQTIYTYPLQYNPITKVLRIYKNITVKITSKNIDGGKNQLIRKSQAEYIDREFDDTYKSRFLNYKTPRYTPLDEKGKMLIISRADCITAMQPFVAWKKLKGIQTEIVSIATVGNTSSAILTYIRNYYTANPTLKFVLFVGDYEDITTPILNENTAIPGDTYNNPGPTDVYYGQLVGSDSYPEVFIGRFSCASVADAQTQVDRTIHYERDLKTTDTWLSKAVMFGNSETTTGGPLNYTNDQYLKNVIKPDLMSTVYNGSPLCVSAPEFIGSVNLTAVVDTVDKGRGTIVQEGEGDQTGFWFNNNLGFTTTNVPTLTNVNKLPHIWSVACNVGSFNGQTCFAEAMMRAQKSGNTGSITGYMSSAEQSWDPPYDEVDEAYSIMTGQQLATNYKITAGGIAYNSSMKMMDDYNVSQAGPFTANTLILFGDPSIVLNTTNLTSMTVTHASTITLGATSFVVNCNVTNALISLTVGGEIIDTAYSNGGANTIAISPAISNATNDTMKVTVTAQNKVTYLGKALITTINSVQDLSSNNNVDIYLNSITNDLNIESNNPNFEGTVYDISGRIVKQFKNERTVNMSSFENGVYLCRLMVDGKIISKKILLMKKD